MESPLERANWEQLAATYFEKGFGKKASELIWRRDPSRSTTRDAEHPAPLFRSLQRFGTHARWDGGRKELDDLLDYYSLMELASLVGVTGASFDPPFVRRALRDLSHPEVRQYYQEDYPLILPVLFLERLQGRQMTRRPTSANSAAFATFLDLHSGISHDKNVESFLWFFDGNLGDDYSMANLVAVCRNPEEFLLRLFRRPRRKQSDPLDRAVVGFKQFLNFCIAFEILLNSTEDTLVRSAMWHFYGYWFDLRGAHLLETMRALFEALGSWSSGAPADVDGEFELSVREARADRDAAAQAFINLTSGIYKTALPFTRL